MMSSSGGIAGCTGVEDISGRSCAEDARFIRVQKDSSCSSDDISAAESSRYAAFVDMGARNVQRSKGSEQSNPLGQVCKWNRVIAPAFIAIGATRVAHI